MIFRLAKKMSVEIKAGFLTMPGSPNRLGDDERSSCR